MANMIMKSWRDGLEKASLIKLQIEIITISLKGSKENTEALLGKSEIVFEIKNQFIAKKFVIESENIGVNCSMQ